MRGGILADVEGSRGRDPQSEAGGEGKVQYEVTNFWSQTYEGGEEERPRAHVSLRGAYRTYLKKKH